MATTKKTGQAGVIEGDAPQSSHEQAKAAFSTRRGAAVVKGIDVHDDAVRPA
jgi:hypothetical protein